MLKQGSVSVVSYSRCDECDMPATIVIGDTAYCNHCRQDFKEKKAGYKKKSRRLKNFKASEL